MSDSTVRRTDTGHIEVNGVEYTPSEALELTDEILAVVREDDA